MGSGGISHSSGLPGVGSASPTPQLSPQDWKGGIPPAITNPWHTILSRLCASFLEARCTDKCWPLSALGRANFLGVRGKRIGGAMKGKGYRGVEEGRERLIKILASW